MRLLLTLAMAASGWAESDLDLLAGRGHLLTFPGEISKVVIAEPRIADAVVVSPREVMVTAKSAGKTTLAVWAGGPPTIYNVNVTPDREQEAQFRREFAEELAKNLPGAAIRFEGNADTLVLSGPVKSREEAERAAALAATRARKVINLLETPAEEDPRQILLQVRFASVDRAALGDLGFNLFSRNGKMLGLTSTQQFQTPRFSQLQFQNNEFANSTLNFADLLNLFLYRPDLNIGATIKALQQRNLLQILAEPNLIAVEGREASFVAGGEFPFPVLQATSTGGAVAPVITVQFRPFGVQLGFTPTLTATGAIRLKVRPEVSSLDFANSVNVQGVLIPALSTRRAETEVILKDGESFAIAGLLDNRVIQTVNKIWGLGDVPVLGQLFRSRVSRKSQDELMVVITPRFVRPLSPEERAQLPETIEPFLPTAAEEKAKRNGEPRSRKSPRKPEFTGPSGHQEPAKP